MIYYGEALFSVERGRGRNKSQKGGKLICYAYISSLRIALDVVVVAVV